MIFIATIWLDVLNAKAAIEDRRTVLTLSATRRYSEQKNDCRMYREPNDGLAAYKSNSRDFYPDFPVIAQGTRMNWNR